MRGFNSLLGANGSCKVRKCNTDSEVSSLAWPKVKRCLQVEESTDAVVVS